MQLTSEGIAAIIVALAGLVSGIYNLTQARQAQIRNDLEKAQKEIESLKDGSRDSERLLEDAMKHIHTQNIVMAKNGIDIPPLPKSLQ